MSGFHRFRRIFQRIGLLSLGGFLLLGNSDAALPQVQSQNSIRVFLQDFEPFGEGEGWVWLGERVYLTFDRGGSWHAVTLPLREGLQVVAVDFEDAINGWLLLREGTASGGAQLFLARTAHGGRNWTVSPVLMLAEDRFLPVARYYLTVWDEATLWIVQELVSSANFSVGILYRTLDGGKTWQRLEVPIAERIRAESALDLWLRGGPSGDEVYRSFDGGLTWVKVLDDPFQAQLLGKETQELRAASTSVGWKLERKGECQAEAESPSSQSVFRQVFRCVQVERLWLTTDGGQNWTLVPLPDGQTALRSEATLQNRIFTLPFFSQSLGEEGPEMPLIAWMQGHGFDKCEVPSLEQLRVWRAHSPYRAVNLYLGGANRTCSNRALNAEFIAQLRQQGWGLIPTWVGLQARCTTHKYRMSKYPPKAYLEGRSEAEAATLAAQRLGLTNTAGSGSVIYYDLEYYDVRNEECNRAAQAFINGWVERMAELGMVGGVYSTGRILSQLAALPNPPPVIWAAHWIYPAYHPEATVWDVLGLANELWNNRQRLRQYTGGHHETWGDVTLHIDSNVMDGLVSFHFYVPSGLNYQSYLPLLSTGMSAP